MNLQHVGLMSSQNIKIVVVAVKIQETLLLLFGKTLKHWDSTF